MLGLKLNHVSKRGHRSSLRNPVNHIMLWWWSMCRRRLFYVNVLLEWFISLIVTLLYTLFFPTSIWLYFISCLRVCIAPCNNTYRNVWRITTAEPKWRLNIYSPIHMHCLLINAMNPIMWLWLPGAQGYLSHTTMNITWQAAVTLVQYAAYCVQIYWLQVIPLCRADIIT